MRRLQTAIAMLIAFTVAYVATPRTSDTLQAQGLLCDCSWLAGQTGSVSTPCLGTADMTSVSCSQFGTQCFLGGYAKWTPAPTNCVISATTSGAITTMGGGSGGPSYFKAANNNNNPGVPWGALSTTSCNSPVSFGASMQVVHNQWTGNCSCTPNTQTVSQALVFTLWRCKDV